MSSRHRWYGVVVVAAVVVMPVAVAVQSGSTEDGSAFATADWPFIGGDWANSRYSALDQISIQSVANLGATWSMRFEAGASSRATPVVKDGLMWDVAVRPRCGDRRAGLGPAPRRKCPLRISNPHGLGRS